MLEDKDLQSIQEVRALVDRAHEAQKVYEQFTQVQVDDIVFAMANAALRESPRLAKLAVEETGYGVPEDKHLKNSFVCRKVFEHIAPLRTMGIISEDPGRKILEIAVPMGVVAAIIPSTNPTSTAIFKCLISLKAGNAVVLSPHPAATRCIVEAARICSEAAKAVGAPEGLIGCMTTPTLDATRELMGHKKVAVILATGGAGLVKAAYSSGKPAYGVGPGNVPAYLHRSADVPKAVRDVLTGKTFDNGTLCSSEQSLIVDAAVEAQVVEEMKRYHARFLSDGEIAKLQAVAIQENGSLNPQIVGKSAVWIAEKAGISVSPATRVLVVRLQGVGREHPLSCEKLSPILTFYVVGDWKEGCERCKQVLAYGGMGHTLSIHCRDEAIIRQFGLEKPAFRICVNTPATHGSIGLSTALPPSMTLGCGTYGNNITTDNITPMHLIQIKRLARETEEVFPSWYEAAEQDAPEVKRTSAGAIGGTVADVVADYLSSRRLPSRPNLAGMRERKDGPPRDQSVAVPPGPKPQPPRDFAPPPRSTTPAPEPVEFVCEQDVRAAVQSHRKIPIGSRTIVTPAARDLGNAHDIFVQV